MGLRRSARQRCRASALCALINRRPAETEGGGKHLHLDFGVQDGRLWVRLSDQGEENAEWEGDSRERPIPGVDE
jgi:hypothetical protein